MNLFAEHKQSQSLWKTYGYQRGQWTAGLGLSYVHWWYGMTGQQGPIV